MNSITRTARIFARPVFVFALICLAESVISAAVVTRGPYLQQGTPTSVVVRWRTDAATASYVRYGTVPASLNAQAESAIPVINHAVSITGLQPDTKYYYQIGTDTGWFPGDTNAFFTTAPVIGTHKPTRVWVLGDSGNANSTAASVASAYATYTGSRPTDVWLMLGDNAYDDGTDAQYQAAVFNMYPKFLRNTVLWPAIGNHDAHEEDNFGHYPYFDIFTLPTQAEAGGVSSGTEKYYSFDWANIHFVCLDSMTSDRSATGAMSQWLRADLEATTQDWLIAYWHHPPYSKGTHNSDTESEMIQMRQNFVPILENYGVDLVLAGHSHSYERSYLIDGHYGSSSTLAPAMKKNGGSGRESGTGAYLKPAGLAGHEGAVYTVAGCSSGGGGASFHPAMFVSGGSPGSLVIDIATNRLDVVFLTQNGVVGDFFTILKPVPLPPNPPGAPTNLIAVATGSSKINLSWSPSSSHTTGFKVERSTDGVNFAVRAILNASWTNGSDTGLSPSTTYYYRVMATNAAGDSPYSAVAQATTFDQTWDVTPPAAVTNLVATGITSNSVTLLWTAPGNDLNSGIATSYDIRLHTENITEANWDTATPVSGAPAPAAAGSPQTFTIVGLAPGTLYFFALKTLDEATNVSLLSNIASGRPNFPTTPIPLVKLALNEGVGTTTVNAGSLGGVFPLTTARPAWTVNVPAGTGGTAAIDYGTAIGNFGVDSLGVMPGLRNLSKFTITGWVNNRSTSQGSGGNRVLRNFINGGHGIDLVYRSDGSLDLGVNTFPNSVARSSPGRITTQLAADAANWRFFAVTYDSSLGANQVQFFFGDAINDAALDVSRTYARGPIGANIGVLTIGHVNPPARSGSTDRMFRGLLDQVCIFPTVLTKSELVAVQRDGNSPVEIPNVPIVTITATDSVGAEAGENPARFTISRLVPTNSPLQVFYNVRGGASNGLDYAVLSGSATIPAGFSAVEVTVTPVDDSIFEGDETVVTTLSPDVTYTIGASNSATVTILDDEPVINVTAADPDAGEQGTNPGRFVIARSGATATPLTVEFTVGGTASLFDYASLGTSVTMAAGASSTNLEVLPVNDDVAEGTETVILTVTPSPLFQITGSGAATVNIVDDDQPPFPVPLVKLNLNEGAGSTTVNAGSPGGVFTLTTSRPLWTTNVPLGAGGTAAIDYGTTIGNFGVDSPGVMPGLRNLSKFTITGWVNNRSTSQGSGGNRVVRNFLNGGHGIDLVYRSDGSLDLGVNAFPNSVARSSPGRITTHAAADVANWRFFAVTYDSSLGANQVQFFFGDATNQATLDVSRTYARGPIGASIGVLTIGHVNPPARSGSTDRMFRGLLDQVCIFPTVLTPSEIVNLQRGIVPPPDSTTLVSVPLPSPIASVVAASYRISLDLGEHAAILAWPSQPGAAYRIEFKDKLEEEWQNFPDEVFTEDVEGWFEDSREGRTQRFYRVLRIR